MAQLKGKGAFLAGSQAPVENRKGHSQGLKSPFHLWVRSGPWAEEKDPENSGPRVPGPGAVLVGGSTGGEEHPDNCSGAFSGC